MSPTVYHILFGDPLPENAELLEAALYDCPSFALAHRAGAISELVSYLAGVGNFVDKARYPHPDLVLLDLNLSGRSSGLQVLKWIQAQASRKYRVVVFAAVADESECEQAYALGADGFVPKPASAGAMVEVLKRIEGWLRNSLREEDPLEFCVA
jgi:DNA-binding NarL/FixJ family response regulator